MPLTWSVSRDQILHDCERRYYFQYLANAKINSRDSTIREVAFLKKLKNIPTWKGDAFHSIVAGYFRRVRQGQFPTVTELVTELHASRFSFWIITLMHDNPLLPILRNPYKLLRVAGLKQGQKVLEVGCGPGFFTMPAAEIVGEEGLIYAIDVNPFAIRRVKKKIAQEGLNNVKPSLTNASNTGLPESSIDLAFLFGLRYIAGGLENVISEMHRILKPGAVLSFEKARGSGEELIQDTERAGFSYADRRGRIFLFTKGKGERSA